MCLFVFAGFSLAGDDTVTAEGNGLGANPAEALLAAKRDAVEKGIGTILLSQTEIENFQLKKDQIITKTIGGVKSFETVHEGKTSDGLYEVTINAVLLKNVMRKDLAAFHILAESADKPRVMVVVDETNLGNDEPGNQAAETAIIQFLKDPYEFDCIDPASVASIRESDKKMAELEGDNDAAASIGTKNGAEVIITGKAISRAATNLSQNLGGMTSVQADVNLKAINCSNGSVIGTAQAHAARVHLNPATAGHQAITQASQKAIGTLLDAITKAWQNEQNNGITMSVTVKGVKSFKLKNEVVQALQGVSGVSAVRERDWTSQGKVLTADVVYKGNTSGFCSVVDGQKLKSGTLDVSGVSGMKVTLRIQ